MSEFIYVMCIVIFIIFYAIVFCVMITDILNNIINNKAKKRMFESIKNIIITNYYDNKNLDEKYCINELELVYKNIVKQNEYLRKYYSSVIIMLEKFLIKIVTSEITLESFEREKINDIKKYIIDLRNKYMQIKPFENTLDKDNILLNKLFDFNKNNDKENFNKTIVELSDEIRNMKNEAYEKEKKYNKQNIFGIIGIVLTCVFGIISLIQFLMMIPK